MDPAVPLDDKRFVALLPAALQLKILSLVASTAPTATADDAQADVGDPAAWACGLGARLLRFVAAEAGLVTGPVEDSALLASLSGALQVTLALSVLLPLLVLGIFRALGAEDAALQFNGKPVSEIVDLTAANAATAAMAAADSATAAAEDAREAVVNAGVRCEQHARANLNDLW